MTKSEARYLQVGAPFACPEKEPPHRDTYERLSGGRYPELVESGGLSPALKRLFQQRSIDVNVAEGDQAHRIGWGWACIRKGSRRSQVVVAINERCFMVEFKNLGFTYGEGSTNDLIEVVHAIELFLVQEASTDRMKSEFSWFFDEGGERAHEKPAESFVTHCWQSLEESLKSEEQSSVMRQLIPLVSEAANRPQLRQLLPFTSLHRLCFSRTTAYPWVQIGCIAWPIGNGLFRITSHDERVLGEGDAVQAADILVAHLPPNCGPAIHGTAETWEE